MVADEGPVGAAAALSRAAGREAIAALDPWPEADLPFTVVQRPAHGVGAVGVEDALVGRSAVVGVSDLRVLAPLETRLTSVSEGGAEKGPRARVTSAEATGRSNGL